MRRAAWLAGLAVAGLATLVGSGGGFPDVCLTPECIGTLDPSVVVLPARTTVQVGTPVTFDAAATNAVEPVHYTWRRDGVVMAGSTGATHVLAGASLADDGVVFSVVVDAANGSATASALLRVSSAPPVPFQDGTFAVADWTATAAVDPPGAGVTYGITQIDDGGQPDAFRAIDYQLPQGPVAIRVFHRAGAAAYDPATLGAVYVVDLGLDCNRVSASTFGETSATPAFEQAGRWYAPVSTDLCAPVWWSWAGSSLLEGDFRRIAGPACTAGERCPDFSAGAPVLRFGFVTGVALPADAPAGSQLQGIDDWTVRVWRR